MAMKRLTLFFGFVGQHWSEGNVTDAFDVLLGGSVLIVDNNASLVVHFNAGSLDVEAFGIGPPANSDEDDVSLQLEHQNLV